MRRKTLHIAMTAALSAALAMPLYAGDPAEHAADKADRTAGEVVDDLGIAARLKTQLAADPVTDAINIDIEVDRSHVQLNGFVDTEEERQRAEQLARNLEGVDSVTNNLQLQAHDRTAGQYLDDKVLIMEVKAALAEEPKVQSLTIDVESDHGVISLGGHVDTNAERIAAVHCAEQVEGVLKVVDNLDVRS